MSGAAPYFGYFGANAGLVTTGYYSYMVGSWRVISLNSEVASSTGSAQMEWLRTELAANPSKCTAVYRHRPLFSSGRHGDNPDMRDVWRTLYAANVDVVINGHDHTYSASGRKIPTGVRTPHVGSASSWSVPAARLSMTFHPLTPTAKFAGSHGA